MLGFMRRNVFFVIYKKYIYFYVLKIFSMKINEYVTSRADRKKKHTTKRRNWLVVTGTTNKTDKKAHCFIVKKIH